MKKKIKKGSKMTFNDPSVGLFEIDESIVFDDNEETKIKRGKDGQKLFYAKGVQPPFDHWGILEDKL